MCKTDLEGRKRCFSPFLAVDSCLKLGRVHIQPTVGKMRITNLTSVTDEFNLRPDLTENIYILLVFTHVINSHVFQRKQKEAFA